MRQSRCVYSTQVWNWFSSFRIHWKLMPIIANAMLINVNAMWIFITLLLLLSHSFVWIPGCHGIGCFVQCWFVSFSWDWIDSAGWSVKHGYGVGMLVHLGCGIQQKVQSLLIILPLYISDSCMISTNMKCYFFFIQDFGFDSNVFLLSRSSFHYSLLY